MSGCGGKDAENSPFSAAFSWIALNVTIGALNLIEIAEAESRGEYVEGREAFRG
jgi:hypothetical protein